MCIRDSLTPHLAHTVFCPPPLTLSRLHPSRTSDPCGSGAYHAGSDAGGRWGRSCYGWGTSAETSKTSSQQ
eukprot:2363465-Rhodomonas_salina.1